MWERIAADTLNWTPGSAGKGNIYRDGSVATWCIDESLDPHHQEMADNHDKVARFLFYIDPDGGIHDNGLGYNNQGSQGDQAMLAKVLQSDPRFFLAPKATTPEYEDFGHARNILDALSRVAAADPEWLRQHIEKNGPYAYHYTYPERVNEIRQQGLLPWDAPLQNPPGSEWEDDALQPRPGHTYLTLHEDPSGHENKSARLTVDMRKLNPTRFMPDEDAALAEWPEWRRIPGYEGIGDPEVDMDYGDMGSSRGEWAETNNLRHPQMVQDSMTNPSGTFAYQGAIPPEAITGTALICDRCHRKAVPVDNINHGLDTECDECRDRINATQQSIQRQKDEGNPLYGSASRLAETTPLQPALPNSYESPANELKRWLDGFTNLHQPVDQNSQLTPHHRDELDIVPQTQPPASQGDALDPPAHPWEPYDWTADGTTSRRGAADPSWLTQWVEQKGPYLWHMTPSSNLDRVMAEGLLPWDVPVKDAPGSSFEFRPDFSPEEVSGTSLPRSGHVYLRYKPRRPGGANGVWVDLRKLDPNRLVPDEDSLRLRTQSELDRMMQDKDVPQHVPAWKDWQRSERGAEEEYPRGEEFSSGQWADQYDLRHPNLTQYSLETGTIAHRGSIPPEALVHGDAFDHSDGSKMADGPRAWVKTAGWTHSQLRAMAGDHEREFGPDQSLTVHEFPDGWSVRAPYTQADHWREGALMGNCLESTDTYVDDPNRPMSEGEPYYHSLRDPYNIPHATWGCLDKQALGRHNSPVKPEYRHYLDELGMGYMTRYPCRSCGENESMEGSDYCRECGAHDSLAYHGARHTGAQEQRAHMSQTGNVEMLNPKYDAVVMSMGHSNDLRSDEQIAAEMEYLRQDSEERYQEAVADQIQRAQKSREAGERVLSAHTRLDLAQKAADGFRTQGFLGVRAEPINDGVRTPEDNEHLGAQVIDPDGDPAPCPHCEQMTVHNPCDHCGEETEKLPVADNDFQQMEREWYDQAWDEPGSAQPFPPQPHHWRQDNASDVSLAKVAANGVFYHVAPAEHRESIQQRGLLPSTEAPSSPWANSPGAGQPPGVYMFDSPENARGYAHLLQAQHGGGFPSQDLEVTHEYDENLGEYVPRQGTGYDMWRVNAKGLPVQIDPESALVDGQLSSEEAQQKINDDTRRWGEPDRTEGHRWLVPHAVEPQRIEHHEHIPLHQMDEYGFEDAMDEGRQIPRAWTQVPIEQWSENARKRYLGKEAKVAALTRKQMLEEAQGIEKDNGQPDQSKVVHEYPDGWTVRQLQTYGDLQREGYLMGNCWNTNVVDNTHPIWKQHPETEHDLDDAWTFFAPEYPTADVPINENYKEFYSLRDPDNLPHVSIDNGDEFVGDGRELGRHNTDPKREYLDRLEQWDGVDRSKDFAFEEDPGNEQTYRQRGGHVAGSAFFTEPHEDLDPTFWDSDERLLPEIRSKIIEGYDEGFTGDYESPLDWATLWIVGSTTSYQYDDDEDLDVQLVVDLPSFRQHNHDYDEMDWSEIRAELHAHTVAHIDGTEIAPGTKWQLFVREETDSETFLRQAEKLNQGVYDVEADQWKVEPVKLDQDFDPLTLFEQWVPIAKAQVEKANDLVQRYRNDPNDETEQAVKDFYTEVRVGRKRSFEGEDPGPMGGGQFGQGNFEWQYMVEFGPMHEMKEIIGAYLLSKKKHKKHDNGSGANPDSWAPVEHGDEDEEDEGDEDSGESGGDGGSV